MIEINENIILIGTSHIARQSLKEVEDTIKETKPEFVCVELDKQRFISLHQKLERKLPLAAILQIGVKGYLFALLGQYIQKKLGRIVNINPGSEMLHAVNVGKSIGAKIALIDQDISITLKRFSKAFSWREKWQFVKDMFRAIFFRKKVLSEIGMTKFNLNEVPDEKTIEKLIGQVKKKYPNLYRVLVEERNYFMANNIVGLAKQFPDAKIIAVIGAGHGADMAKIIKEKLKSVKSP